MCTCSTSTPQRHSRFRLCCLFSAGTRSLWIWSWEFIYNSLSANSLQQISFTALHISNQISRPALPYLSHCAVWVTSSYKKTLWSKTLSGSASIYMHYLNLTVEDKWEREKSTAVWLNISPYSFRKLLRCSFVLSPRHSACLYLINMAAVLFYLRIMTFWTRGDTASACRRRAARTCSSAWNWTASCWSGKRLFRWPLSWRWRGYRSAPEQSATCRELWWFLI